VLVAVIPEDGDAHAALIGHRAQLSAGTEVLVN
jgi:hypothetical protein